MKYIAQSVPGCATADQIEYLCFSEVLLSLWACFVLLNLCSAAFHSEQGNTAAIASI